jgi:hypothetical protein
VVVWYRKPRQEAQIESVRFSKQGKPMVIKRGSVRVQIYRFWLNSSRLFQNLEGKGQSSLIHS